MAGGREQDAAADPIEQRLQEWAAWLGAGKRGDGFPALNVLHHSWMPPPPGMTPTLRAAKRGDAREREVHQAVGRLSIRLSNTLVVVYLQRVAPDEQARRLDCAESTVRARVIEAKRRVRDMLQN